MRLSRHTILCLALLAVLGTAGCGQKNQASPQTSGIPSSASVQPENASASPSGAALERTVDVYYSDPDLTKLIPQKTVIRYQTDKEVYLAALNALKSAAGSDVQPLCPELVFRSATRTGDKLTVDLSVPDQARLGAGGEAMLIDALRKTIFQFPELQSFELLVDGQKAESLMGHMELLYPFQRTSN